TKCDKVQQVDAAVLATFTETRIKMLPVHDSDLAKWALETANKIGLQFLASKKWIYNFKRRHELAGRMRTRVEETYFQAPNVEVTCSSLGKLTTSLFERYVDYVLGPLLTGDCLLLLDSWGGQQSDECFQGIENLGFTCTRLRIPEGAMPTTQPLDVFYNRQYKGVVKKFYDHVSTQGLNINLYQRDHIIKLHSLVHHQFANDRFAPMGR